MDKCCLIPQGGQGSLQRWKYAQPYGRGGGILASEVLRFLLPPGSPLLAPPSCWGNQKVYQERTANNPIALWRQEDMKR